MTSRPSALRAGGELEFDLETCARRTAIDPSTRFGARACLWTDTGRSALLLAANAIAGNGGRRRAWLPAYSCASVAQPFLQAGFELRYYAVGADLGAASSALPQPERGDTLLYIHYFGLRNRRLAQAVPALRASGVWVIEDCAQAGLGAQTGGGGDFTVTSFRKLLPVTDGAALLADSAAGLEASRRNLAPADEAFVSARALGKLLRAGSDDAQGFLPLFEWTERRLDGPIVPRHRSWISEWMLHRLDWDLAARSRRGNWRALADGLAAAALGGLVSPIFGELAEDEVPLGFPVRVAGGRRDALRRSLAQAQVYCAVHWPLDHVGGAGAFREERELAASILTLPIDQRMDGAHIGHVVATLAACNGAQ